MQDLKGEDKSFDKGPVTYLLSCADGSLYCGWTNHLKQRLDAHNRGKGAKYTKARRPVALYHVEAYATKEEAMQREYQIKRLTRAEKLALGANGAAIEASLEEKED